jgi:hypothetical protein
VEGSAEAGEQRSLRGQTVLDEALRQRPEFGGCAREAVEQQRSSARLIRLQVEGFVLGERRTSRALPSGVLPQPPRRRRRLAARRGRAHPERAHHQPSDPGSPLNGPTTSDVIQPP